MDNDEKRMLYQQVIGKLGIENRLDHLQEECCECAAVRNHLRRGRVTIHKLVEEMVDVEIMLEQMHMIYPFSLWDEIKNKKLERLKERQI